MIKGKIVYFDYWTVGINNFKLFDTQLKNNGFETKLIHLNSWKGIQCPEYEQINGIDCYDIKYYRTNLIHKVLKAEKPTAVVMLNVSFITDRTVILSCKKIGIKSVYLMHGSLTREDFIEESIRLINQSFKRKRLQRALKHIKGTVLNYFNSIILYDKKYLFKSHAYKILWKTFTDPGTYLHFPPSSFDLIPDLALVYGIMDQEFYRKRFSNYNSVIKVVGNPDLDKYFQEIENLSKDKDAFCKAQNIPLDKPYVTYIEEGLVEDRIWENEQRIKFFQEINAICQEVGLNLVIKLHPRTAKGPYRDSFDSLEGVTVLTQVNFPKLIYFTEKCISHYSTTLVYPILLNKPILVPRWGNSAKILAIYTDKEVTFVYSMNDFKKLIKDSNLHYDRNEYINNFVPFVDGKTSERIVNYILDLIK